MKMTRRMTAFTVVLALLAMMLMPASAAAASKETPYEIRNDEARRLYSSLVEASRAERARTGRSGLQTRAVTGGSEEEARFTGDFEVLSLAVGEEDDKQIIYNDTDGSAYTVIEYNTATGAYALLEASTDSEEVLYMVDGEAFLLVMDGENVNMVSESGEILPVIETEYAAPASEDFTGNAPPPTLDTAVFHNEYSITSSTSHNWSQAYGPYYKTNKQWCFILKILERVATAATIKLNHPILGVITLGLQIAQDIAESESIWVTMYIRYYNYYDLNDMYWTRELQYWYADENRTQLVKTIDKINYDDTPW